MSGEHLHLHCRMYNKQVYFIDNLKKTSQFERCEVFVLSCYFVLCQHACRGQHVSNPLHWDNGEGVFDGLVNVF